jgi:sulfate adenylyltransferase subunit 1
LSRGDLLCSPQQPPQTSNRFAARIVWMNEEPLKVGVTYLIKHTTRTVRATATAIRHRINVNTLELLPAEQIDMNDIAEVEFHTARPLFFDPYASNHVTGSFILIDPLGNATLGAGMIESALADEAGDSLARLPQFIHMAGRAALATQLHNALRAEGHNSVLLDDAHIAPAHITAAVRAAQLAGAVAISSAVIDDAQLAAIQKFVDAEHLLAAATSESDDSAALAQLLHQIGVAE